MWVFAGDESKKKKFQLQKANAKDEALQVEPAKRQTKFMHLFCIQSSPPCYAEVID